MSLLKACDKGIFHTVYVICGALMIAILVILNVQVFSRFLFNFSLGGLSDAPPYLMVYTVWIGGILAARSDDHIKIQILDLVVKNKKVLAVIDVVLYLLIAFSLLFFMKSSMDYTAHAFSYGSTDQGTGIPLWCFYIILPIGSAFMSLYYVVNAIKKVKEDVLCRS